MFLHQIPPIDGGCQEWGPDKRERNCFLWPGVRQLIRGVVFFPTIFNGLHNERPTANTSFFVPLDPTNFILSQRTRRTFIAQAVYLCLTDPPSNKGRRAGRSNRWQESSFDLDSRHRCFGIATGTFNCTLSHLHFMHQILKH
jgi:hypothetical protein